MSVAYSDLPYFIRGIVNQSTYLYSSSQWTPVGEAVTLRFNFATSPVYGEQDFLPYTEAQKTSVREALSLFSEVTGLAFEETTASGTAELTFFRDDLTAHGGGGYHAWAYYPYIYSDLGGDVHIHSGYYPDSDTFQPGNYAFQLLMHEIGHALGLVHTFEYGVIPSVEDTQFNSVMTYNNQWPYMQNLGMFDLAALHTLYGVEASARAGADVYTLADCYIWDGGGIDTLDCTGEALRLNIRLAEGSWIWAGTKSTSILSPGQAFIGFGTNIERAKGGTLADSIQGNGLNNMLWGNGGADVLRGHGGADTLWGGAGHDKLYGGAGMDRLHGGAGNDLVFGEGGNDLLNGNDGNDTLEGGVGTDTLSGGSGSDLFVFLSPLGAGNGAARDVITDFASGIDFIHLAAMDADIRTAVHDSFSFLGAAAFTGSGGELRYAPATGILAGDVDGDRLADFQVLLVGQPSLQLADLILSA